MLDDKEAIQHAERAQPATANPVEPWFFIPHNSRRIAKSGSPPPPAFAQAVIRRCSRSCEGSSIKRQCRTDLLCGPPHRDEPDLDSLMQGGRNPSQHCQRMTFVIRVLKAADDRRRCADKLAKLSLSEACGCAQLVDLAGDLFVRPRLFKFLQPVRPAFVNAAVQDLQRITGWSRPLCHINPPHVCASAGSRRIAICDRWHARFPSAELPAV